MRNLTNTYRIGFAVLTSLFVANNGIASGQGTENLPAFDRIAKNPVESCICDGLTNMLEENPVAALNKLDLASFQRQQLNLGWDETDFLIAFCKVIACDRLGWQQASVDLQNILFTSLDEDTFDALPTDVSITPEEALEAIGFLSGLVSLAPTPNVQMMLQSIITQLAGEALPTFQFASTSLLDRDWQFASAQQNFSKIQLCNTSKTIKRWKHILKKAWEWFEFYKDAKKFLKEVEKELNS